MSEAQQTVVEVETTRAVTTITLNSPSNRNALSSVLVGQLSAALAEAADDTSVRAVVLTHAGGTFCAGADLGEALRRGLSPEEATAEGARAMVGLMRTMLAMPKPVIVVANGHVRAGGFGLLGSADIALVGPEATFALTEARLGLAPSIISIVLLPKMSARSAGRYFLTGEKFDPATAERIGLVTQASSSAEELSAVLDDVLTGVRKASPQGLAASKRLTTAAILADFDENATARAAESAALFASDEAREGMTAFLSKGKPSWDTSER
ncbi:putative enoyl-CoA hydratase [Gordonia araii NBRC 100433]|uniref:Putative enoyl-CoA hydratase n=1 Tax=Gordonia araii NBRC 100433 TaxID=1073574 RepID=G7H3T0_9ACTN|nr:enoyl-CoA hydratase family protein [Gordonia araii]NNG98673.1 enoyl-CoA hydratase family protein [Gordonia araii NBRC 100433]GAB10505.1 putative enoyl-CoA hydratase [Gordonia araii NBRC 100433]